MKVETQGPKLETNICLRFLEMAKKVPDQIATITDETILNYKQAAQIVGSMAVNLAKCGVNSHSVIVVDTDDFVTSMATLFSASLLGATWVSFRTFKLQKGDISPTHFFTTDPIQSSSSLDFHLISDSWINCDESQILETLEKTDVDNDYSKPWIITNTSGTTGTAKLIGMPQITMLYRIEALKDDFRKRETVFCGLFHCSAFPYISFTCAALVNGCTVARTMNSELMQIAGVNLIHGSVAQVSSRFGGSVESQKLPSIHVGGAKLPDGLARHLLKSFHEVVEIYASTESGRSFKTKKMLDANDKLISIGITQDSTIELMQDMIESPTFEKGGAVRVRNKYLASGYLNNKDAERMAFIDGWFYTGDLASWGEHGELKIHGRTSEIVNIGGYKINPNEVDEVLVSIAGVKDAMSFETASNKGANEYLAFIIPELDDDAENLADEILANSIAMLGPHRSPSKIIVVSDLPRAKDGGAKRYLCEEIYKKMLEGKSSSDG